MNAPAHTAGADELNRVLAQEIQAAGHLLRLLEDEHAALRGDDPDRLLEAVAAKERCAQSLERLTRRHRALLAGRAADTVPEDALGEELQRLAEACRRQNAANGRLVEARRRHAEQALAILRGQSPGTAGYDPRGRPLMPTASRDLSKA